MPHIDIDARQVVDIALQKLKSLRIDAAELSANRSSGFSVTARLGDVETTEHHLEKNFGVTVFHKQSTGSASSSDFSLASISATIEKAAAIARFSNADPYAGLADPDRLAKNYPDCDLYHPWDISPADAIQLAMTCEKKAVAADARIINSEGASVSTTISNGVYANTLGFVGHYLLSEHALSCSVVARDQDQMQRDDEYTIARNAKDLTSVDEIAKRAAEKTVMRLGARRIKTQSCPVIFNAPIAKSLLGAFVQAISGGSLYRQSSFLLNAMGKQIFPSFVNVNQQPHLLSAMGSRPFDHDGVATVDQHYIEEGVLSRYVLSSYSARKLGLKTTGNAGGVFNLSIQHADVTLHELMQEMGTGLLVTELMGQGTNIVTGDYSRGAAGFWIEQGKIQFPVEEITIAGNLKNMFAGIVSIANDVDMRSAIRTGSILIDRMMIAGE
ncbi:MAG: metalloprotease PmbA [Gammaproteobacteria bacterium CG_4_10_14_0_8_um_filter_38_16]|nr:MAG: metalloprotease PmbA [Gammaproteobacteria bacterium CG_4_10_14_0_8_um_filter_38_16]PJA03482.1 MAG: metalloprotease PmbA [Gammaproteobacteria bacterium CG_4_10_14_0_2_um_filter_38_22]PJB10637.1 MAG: metalloprotease PmbA [Gammaproteobacteria bacterium CG_4_9_14_3_um_filter_38_9]